MEVFCLFVCLFFERGKFFFLFETERAMKDKRRLFSWLAVNDSL